MPWHCPVASVLGAILLAWALPRMFRHDIVRCRLRDGCCLSCGYDLRAARDRCPECGEAFQNPLSIERLRRQWPASPMRAAQSEDSLLIECVYETLREQEAYLVYQQPIACGIPAKKNFDLHPRYRSLMVYRVHVARADAETARAVVMTFADGT
jgi:hypothetical protein